MEVEVVSDVETPVKKSEKQECTVEEMFPYLPAQSPRQLSIAEGIITDRQVDVVMHEAEPDWAAEIARLDRQWDIRFTALEDQWNHRCSNLTRDWGSGFSKLDQQWVELAGSLQQQLSTLRQWTGEDGAGEGPQHRPRYQHPYWSAFQATLGERRPRLAPKDDAVGRRG